jgi:hypothetical protein
MIDAFLMGSILFSQPKKKETKTKKIKKSGGVAQYFFGKKNFNPKKKVENLLNVHSI